VSISHRLDIEGARIPQKKVLSSISLCLGHKEDFRSDVIREALADLLNDELPAQPLMRTAILAAQSHGNEMKKFVLGDVIPTIIRKKVWETAPKVWDGVSHAVKLLAEHKTAEPTLRCLLGLPKAQLKAVIKAVPKVKAPLGKLIVALSAEEKDEVISGRWAGIADGDSTAVDAEKAKIIKDLSTAT
jgi:Symplekin tight junction protein C terminal